QRATPPFGGLITERDLMVPAALKRGRDRRSRRRDHAEHRRRETSAGRLLIRRARYAQQDRGQAEHDREPPRVADRPAFPLRRVVEELQLALRTLVDVVGDRPPAIP